MNQQQLIPIIPSSIVANEDSAYVTCLTHAAVIAHATKESTLSETIANLSELQDAPLSDPPTMAEVRYLLSRTAETCQP